MQKEVRMGLNQPRQEGGAGQLNDTRVRWKLGGGGWACTLDLVVFGSGPAGEKGAAQAAYFGKKVALVEKTMFLGGAAANTGTLPSKTLRETALFLTGFRQRQLFGLDFRGLKESVTVRDFLM